eukprot:jgi/Antlo1/2258/2076
MSSLYFATAFEVLSGNRWDFIKTNVTLGIRGMQGHACAEWSLLLLKSCPWGFTAMEDCYYFLYSKCTKGPNCKFRHSHSAKENPVLCRSWEQKKPCSVNCPFRHSDYHLRKARSEELCYWESTTGCNKEFCEFKHRDSRKDEWKNMRVKTLDEIRKQKKRQKKDIYITDNAKEVVVYTSSSDDKFLEEIDRELGEIDELLGGK